MLGKWKKIACPHDCPGGCIMEARYDVPSGSLEFRNIEKKYGINGFCSKGLRWFERRRHPLRISTPLLRGESSFYPISWQKAWDLWARALEEGLRRSGPLGNALYQSAGSLYFSKNFLSSLHGALGGYTTSKGNLCSSAGNQGLRNCFGQVPVQPLDVLEREGKSLLFWGRNVRENHLPLLPLARKLRNRGGKMGVVEIRNTPTVSWCDDQWFLAPGGDCFLAAWLCKRLLEERRASASWSERVENPEEFASFLESLEEEQLLVRGGISRKEAVSLYQWLLDSAPVTHYLGYGMQRYLHGELQAWWIGALAVLSGAFQVPGAGVVFGKNEMARFPASLLSEPSSMRSFPEGCFWQSLEKANPSVHTLAIFCGNPVKQAPRGKEIARIIQNLSFSVCSDFTLTETARCCSLVLPSLFFFEEGPDWRGSYSHSFLCRTETLLPPPEKSLGDLEILEGLATTLGLSLSPRELLHRMDSMLLEDEKLEERENSLYFWEEPNFWSQSSSSAKLPVTLPRLHFTGEGRGLFEFRLITYHVQQYINGQNWDLPEEPYPPVYLSSEDARKIGLVSGDMVRLRSSGNSEGFVAMAEIDPKMRSGYCAMPQGIPLVNTLTVPMVSPGYGVPFSENFVRLTKE
ncbi:MAG TPA: molybdopterin-dependent oxidoreductase [Synergistaceae bacterium]|nr:molybdopterin-dependent oxidoreductase [Synergistaceae bacterium]HPQ36973.1 molybdopterin-dependent oxidoreductase [Synergistaceae bacterium]